MTSLASVTNTMYFSVCLKSLKCMHCYIMCLTLGCSADEYISYVPYGAGLTGPGLSVLLCAGLSWWSSSLSSVECDLLTP